MFDQAIFAARARQIIEAGHFLYGRGWSPATSSNYSARIDSDHVAITVSGRHKGQLGVDDVMVVDLNGQAVGTQRRSSAETLLHTVIYQLCEGVGAVLHTHSVNATVFSRLLADEQRVRFRDYELQKAFPGVHSHEGDLWIPIFDNTQDIPTLARITQDYIREHPETPGYLIRGHGLYTWGETMADCLRHVEAMEFLINCEMEMMRLSR